MPSGTHSSSCQIGSAVNSRTVTKTADNANTYGDATVPIVLAAGMLATDWVKTDADTAACNLPAGHGYGASATVDVFDAATGECYRYGVTATITTNAAALEGGTAPTGGSGFPANGTSCIVCKQQQVNLNIDGDLAEMVSVKTNETAHVDFQDASSHSIRALTLQADEPDNWDSDMAENPYTGDPITKAMISNGTATAGTFTCSVLQDSTP